MDESNEEQGRNEEEEQEEDDFIQTLCNEYCDDEFINYFKTTFAATAVQVITEMVSIALDSRVLVHEDRVHDALQDVLCERGIPRRSVPRFLFSTACKEDVGAKIQLLDEAPDVGQRTSQWYEKRHNLLTATASRTCLRRRPSATK